MSYTPTTWVTGDKVTATKMNKLEQGVANSGGYDAVIKLDDVQISGVQTATLVKGSYESLKAKAEVGDFYSVAAYGTEEDGYGTYTAQFNVLYTLYDVYVAEGDDPKLYFYISDYRNTVTAYVSSTSGGSNNNATSILVPAFRTGYGVAEILLESDGSISIISKK